jgi:hypothetical protein
MKFLVAVLFRKYKIGKEKTETLSIYIIPVVLVKENAT